MLRRISLPFLLLLFFFPHFLQAQANEKETGPPFAEDASDRAYLGRVLALIDSAEESVDVAMFTVNVKPVPDDPGYRLVEALQRAAEQGKQVRLWLNSRQASVGSSRIFMRPDIQQALEGKGIKIFYVDPRFRLHDKLIVIDSERVVDGSMNWTREALVKNFESVSIIRSKKLAQRKVARLELLPLLRKKDQLGGPPLEEKFPFPVDLLRKAQIFPASLERQEARTLALYLLLVDEGWRGGEKTFSISLEEWGEKLPFKKRWIGSSLRFEMRRTLDFLKTRYGLIDWEKAGTEEAQVTLKPVSSSEQVFVPYRFLEGGYVRSLSPSALYTYLIARHKAQISGNVPFWLGPVGDVAKEFSLSPVTLLRGLWELKRANLIEIFPSEKKIVEGRWEREFTNRYLFNRVLLSSERTQEWEALQKKYGDQTLERARGLADSIDEPEDFEVVETFAQFLTHYPAPEVEEAVRTVARFNRNNALRTTAYVRGILEGGGGD